MGSKKKKKDRSRERDKSRDRHRSRDKDRKRRKKDRSHSRRKKGKDKKYRSSSESSYSDSSASSSPSSQSRHRSHDKKSRKKKDKSVEKKTSKLPFNLNQPVLTPTFTPVGGMIIAPPPDAKSTTPTPTITKAKVKEYHIFKLFPKLPAGAVALGQTVYSSKYVSKNFEHKLFEELCEQLQKSAKAENAKKMAGLISKTKNEIMNINIENEDRTEMEGKSDQFKLIKETYQQRIRKIHYERQNKPKKIVAQEVHTAT